MAFAYRSSSTQGSASGDALTVNKPAGTLDGDLIVVVGHLETGTNSWASVGAGFNLIAETPAAGTNFNLRIWWKWASGEPASWTWTPTVTGWRNVTVASYSGGGGSGADSDVHSSNSGLSQIETAQTAPSVLTTANDDLLVFGFSDYAGADPVSLVGAATNLRAFINSTTIGDANIATPTNTGTTRPNGTGTQDFCAIHSAFFLSPGGATYNEIGSGVSQITGSGIKSFCQKDFVKYQRFPKFVLRKAIPR